jgi:hypothetical protein
MHKVGRYAVFLFLALIALYLADAAVFEIRLSRGSGLSNVPVEQYLKTSLKGQKMEFYFQGTKLEDCVRSVFPQRAASKWNPPCWWLERHRQHWQEAAGRSHKVAWFESMTYGAFPSRVTSK